MINLKKKAISLFLIFSLLVCIVGAVNLDETYAATKKSHIKKATISLVAGNTYQQKLIDKNGKAIKASRIKWKSLKTSVAEISKSGRITAVRAGTARMTAKYKGKTYKFTVKAKAPFKKGKKPTGLKIQYVYSDAEIDICWNGMKNAEEYQIYLSKDGGPFTVAGSTEKTSFVYRSNEEGREFSFKVRAVCGKYKSSFSKIKSMTVPGQAEYEANDRSDIFTF